MKTLLVVLYGLDDPERHKRFLKVLRRKTKKTMELFPNCWIVTVSNHSRNRAWDLANSLNSLLDEKGEDGATESQTLVITSIVNDWEHLSGWLAAEEQWDELREITG